VDYRLHDGCAARTWVAIEVGSAATLPLHEIRFAAAGADLGSGPPVIDVTTLPVDRLLRYQQYSPLPARLAAAPHKAQLTLQPAHNSIELWNWGEPDCSLARGATRAVLVDQRPAAPLALEVGDVLVLEETHDPLTGGGGPADPGHRQAVRLTAVTRLEDELFERPLVEVRWDDEDALGFELAVRAGGKPCACARGNVVLVAAGRRVDEQLEQPPLVLSAPGLCFSTPFPDSGLVASHQARRLRGLYDAWRDEIYWWLIEAVRGTSLSTERRARLRSVLGEDALERFGLVRDDHEPADENETPDKYDTRAEGANGLRAELDAYGLGELLADADRLLAARRRRLETLATMAEGSGPLDAVLIDELAQDWGQELVRGLAADRPEAWGPASGALQQDARAALPVLELRADARHAWQPKLDLIDLRAGERAVVAEVDDDGIAELRLGPDRPADAGPLAASYWVGNGAGGNAEAEAINAVVWLGRADRGSARPGALDAIRSVRNPLPASGGIDPEAAAEAKHAIPGSFQDDQPRALTADDYASLASRLPGVRRAAAELRFTGSLTVVDIAVQPSAREDPGPPLLERVKRGLDQPRRIGHVVRVGAPRYRPLFIALDVVVAAIAVRATIADQLARLLSSGWLADGSPALFNPIKLGFATPVYSSPVIAAVHAVDGVESGRLTQFGFLGEGSAKPTSVPERLSVGQMEIARLDNDPTAPEHGYVLISLEGGR
jgi:predicted phage baseplate assembly protein